MKLSARNVIPGKVEHVHKGAVTTTLKVDVGNGIHIMSSITNEAAEDLNLKVDDKAAPLLSVRT